jgi:penicillin amidase
VLFANDPHISYSQPSVWYEAHINTPNYEIYGYYLAGVPFPLLGHNRNYAYGLTMFENDDIDFYKETNHPTDSLKYKTPKGYENYKTTIKTIKVKDQKDVKITVKKTRHGPIMNNAIENITQSEPISMSWIFTTFNVDVLKALYTISNATKMEDVKKGASMIYAPGLNIMYGDVKGNIAWWATGKLYKNKPHVNRKFILDGSTGEDDPIEYLDFSENPMAENPKWNYVYSANNQPDSIASILYPGYYLPEDRAKRIVQLLEPKNDWNKNDFKKMITDNISVNSSEIIKILTSSIQTESLTENQQKSLQILQNWDGSNTTKNIASTIYSKWIYLYLENTFEDELGKTLFNQLLKTHIIKRVISNQIKKEESIWWDNVETVDKTESRSQILLNSFIETINSLENQLGKDILNWNWGKIHTLEHPHPLGTIASLRSIFNVGPFEASGTIGVIDNKSYEFTDSGIYNVFSGPSTRRIIDFSDIENSISILPTGQSGNPFSKFYKDQAKMYNKGEFRKMKLNKQEIISTSTKLTLLPTNE